MAMPRFLTKKYLRLLLVLGWSTPLIAQDVMLASYHDFPPFITGKDKGLTYELARELNHRAQGRYVFHVSILPRKRLDYLLEHPQEPMLIPWVATKMLNDQEESRYIWGPKVMYDRELIISLYSKRPDPANPDSFNGLRFAGIRGHRYPEIQSYIDQGKLVREDGNSPEQSLKLLAAGRVNLTMMSESTASYLLRTPQYRKQMVITPPDQNSFIRRIATPKGNEPLMQFVESTIKIMARNPDWLVTYRRYGQKWPASAQ